MWWQTRSEVQILSALKAPTFVLILGLFLSIFAETCVAIAHSEDPIHGEEFPVVQPQLILEIRTTTIVRGLNVLEEEFDLQRRNRIDGIDNEKAHLLKKLQKPAKKTDYTKGHLRYRLLSAIDGFQRFGKTAESGIQRKREAYRKLTHWQKQVRIHLLLLFPVELGLLVTIQYHLNAFHQLVITNRANTLPMFRQ